MNFEVTVVVEIPHGSMYKYEIDKKTSQLVVDRPLDRPLPYNYGYVPQTLHEDGDPLDICIISKYPIFPLTKVRVVLLGAWLCQDNGCSDHKLVGQVVGEDYHRKEERISGVKNYLQTYKEGFTVDKWVDAPEAYEILMKDLQAYQNT